MSLDVPCGHVAALLLSFGAGLLDFNFSQISHADIQQGIPQSIPGVPTTQKIRGEFRRAHSPQNRRESQENFAQNPASCQLKSQHGFAAICVKRFKAGMLLGI